MSRQIVEMLSLPTCFGVFVTLLVTGSMLAIQLGQYRMVRGFHHVLGTVVDFETRWDESYKRDELFPVVEVVLPTGPTRSTIESGFMTSGGAPMMKRGDTLKVYVDPQETETARVLMPWTWTLLLGPFVGAVTFGILLLSTFLGCHG